MGCHGGRLANNHWHGEFANSLTVKLRLDNLGSFHKRTGLIAHIFIVAILAFTLY
jgi:hypothetical protein